MLPYTTFKIPEYPEQKTASKDNWLWIILNEPSAPAEAELLSKIIPALHADPLTHVHELVVAHGDVLSLSSLGVGDAKLVISFGVIPSRLGLWIDLESHGMRRLEIFSFILTAPLRDLNTNAVAKKNLWTSMQRFLDKK